jgi:virginiamycin B lyase
MARWSGIAGALNQISVGSTTNVWGVNAANQIFRYSGNDNNPWIQIPGSLIDVAVAADGTVWGVNIGNAIYRYSNGSWTIIPGALKQITVGSATNVWGGNAANQIFRYSGDDNNPWIQIPGSLIDVAVAADGTVWGVNTGNAIFRYNSNGSWTVIPGALKHISVGSATNVWGVNAANQIFRYSGDDNNPWIQIPGSLTDVSAAADGTVWGVDAAGNILRFLNASGDVFDAQGSQHAVSRSTMDSLTHLAVMTKAQLVFGAPDTFLSFPALFTLSYSPEHLSFANTSALTAEQLRRWAEFCQVTNSLPTGMVFQPPADRYLWDIYQEILKTSILAACELSTEQQATLAEAQGYLRSTGPDGQRTESPALLAYKLYRDAWFKAVQDYKTQQLTASTVTDPKQQTQWTEMDEPALRARVAEAEMNWESKGNKADVERAQQVETTAAAQSPQRRWADWASQIIPDIDLLTDPNLGQFGRTEFVPSNALEEKDWSSSTLTAFEIGRLVGQAPKELAAIFGDLSNSSDIESVSFEYRSVGVTRHWFRPQPFGACCWKLPDASRQLSDGGDPPQGEWPAYITAIVFARNFLVKTRAASAPPATPSVAANVAPPPVFWGAGGDGMIMNMPVIPPPPPPVPMPPPQPEPQVSTDVSILCFICKRLPKCPNPDPKLKW